MPSVRISNDTRNGIYFVTFSVKNLYYLFDRQYRWNILSESLKYCREHKGLKIFGFVFMLNHLHLICSAPDVSAFVRDFKRFTSKKIHENISLTEPNVLELFLKEGGTYEFWARTNMPKRIESVDFFENKLRYIHNNRVRKQYVAQPDYWYWSSANPTCELAADDIHS